jgi:DNA-binding NarL/FixJ family response regulator
MKRRAKEMRILIAADHAVVRSGIQLFLRNRQEWKICGEAATAAEAIEKAGTLRPDLLLLDVPLPDMDTAKAIRQIIEVASATKIVAVVEKDSPELAASALAAGAKGVVLKSEGASELVSSMQNVAEGRSFLSPGAVAMIQSQLAKPNAIGPERADLTPREFQILESLARGLGNKELAAVLGISVKTVDAHRASIMRKLKLDSYSELVQFAVRQRIIKI